MILIKVLQKAFLLQEMPDAVNHSLCGRSLKEEVLQPQLMFTLKEIHNYLHRSHQLLGR
jgi:hypothetical protein